MDGFTDIQKHMHNQIREALVPTLTLPEPNRSRSLMCLAYEYFVLDMEEYGFDLLKRADPLYFSEQLKNDMKSIDPNLKDIEQVVLSIIQKLIEGGYIKMKQGIPNE